MPTTAHYGQRVEVEERALEFMLHGRDFFQMQAFQRGREALVVLDGNRHAIH